MNPIFCRAGSKRDMINLLERIEPSNYTKYVEPFVGGGAVYWSKSNLDIPKVINDKEERLTKGYKIIKSGTLNNLERFDTNNLGRLTDIYKGAYRDDAGYLSSVIIGTCNTFGSSFKGLIYKNSNPYSKLKKIDAYREAMKKTKILNQDYKSVISSEDGAGTFFFIDPPYVKSSKGLYKEDTLNVDELLNAVRKIKGKFILTIDDIAENRNAFREFRVRSHVIKAKGNVGVGAVDRSDLIITNF